MAQAKQKTEIGFPLSSFTFFSYGRAMKRILFFLIALSLCGGRGLRAQDAATEERLKKLNGLVQDLLESKETQRKQIESLSREIQSLREQVSKPTGNYATQDDLRTLAKKLQEIDENRIKDNKKIVETLDELGKKGLAPAAGKKSRPKPESSESPTPVPTTPEKGFEHIVASGDTLSTIAQAYRDKSIKVTVDQILKANPGLVPEKMKVGQKLFIPAPEK